MKSFNRSPSQIIIVLLVGISIWGYIILNTPVAAQSPTRLNAEITSLRSRVNRLESEVRRLSKSIPQTSLARPDEAPPNISRGVPPTVVDGEVIGRSDPTVERLSILLIELKEDLQSLDRRVTDIEAKSGS